MVATIDWCRSKSLGVDIDPEGNRHVRVGSLVRWWYFSIIPVIALISPYLNPILSWLILAAWCFAPEILFSRRYLNVREVDASEAAAERGDFVPHPDALPAIQLPKGLFVAGQGKSSKDLSASPEL